MKTIAVHNSGMAAAGAVRALAAALLLAAAPGTAQITDLRLPISLDADSTNYDGKSSMLMFEGLRLSQGPIGVEADFGRASRLDFEDSVWEFTGNVVIDTETSHVECDSADLSFSGHQLARATVAGTPATFELRRPGSAETTYAEADRVDYDFARGIVEFSGNAVITEGGNQISSDYLVYNIAEQRINAQAAAEGDSRVKITYTPRAAGPEADGAGEAAEPETDSGAGADAPGADGDAETAEPEPDAETDERPPKGAVGR